MAASPPRRSGTVRAILLDTDDVVRIMKGPG